MLATTVSGKVSKGTSRHIEPVVTEPLLLIDVDIC